MGVIKFIIGILGILLIIGTASAFLPLVLLGGFSSGSLTSALALPIILFIIGAVMVYFGFYSSKSKSNFNYSWFIKWGLIHSFSIWLSSTILSKLKLEQTIIIIFVTGLIISIISSIIRKGHSNIKWFFLYLMIHSTSFWIINFYLLPWIGINDLIIKILLSGFILTGITTITAKLDLRKKEVAVILILFILIILFNFNTSNINLNNQSPDNTNNIDPLCKEKVEYIIGNHFIISYRTKENINSRELKSFSTKFLGSSEQFESDSYSVMGIEYSPLGQSKTTDRKVINSNIRLGEKQGENKDWLYGNINYEYTYTKKDIVDDKGIILGDNHFKITVKIDDLSSYFPKYYVVDSESPNGKSLHLSIPISIENIVTVTECSLVDYEIFHSKFDI